MENALKLGYRSAPFPQALLHCMPKNSFKVLGSALTSAVRAPAWHMHCTLQGIFSRASRPFANTSLILLLPCLCLCHNAMHRGIFPSCDVQRLADVSSQAALHGRKRHSQECRCRQSCDPVHQPHTEQEFCTVKTPILTHTLFGKGADKEMLWQAHRLRGHV